MSQSRLARTRGKKGLIALTLLSLSLLSGCSTSKHHCLPPNVTPWMMDEQPLHIELTEPLFKTLSNLQLEPSSNTENAAID